MYSFINGSICKIHCCWSIELTNLTPEDPWPPEVFSAPWSARVSTVLCFAMTFQLHMKSTVSTCFVWKEWNIKVMRGIKMMSSFVASWDKTLMLWCGLVESNLFLFSPIYSTFRHATVCVSHWDGLARPSTSRSLRLMFHVWACWLICPYYSSDVWYERQDGKQNIRAQACRNHLRMGWDFITCCTPLRIGI